MEAKKVATVQFEVAVAFYFGGEVQEVGSTVTLPKHFAIEAQAANRGKIVPDAQPPQPAPSADESKAAPAPAAEKSAEGEDRKGFLRRKDK